MNSQPPNPAGGRPAYQPHTAGAAAAAPAPDPDDQGTDGPGTDQHLRDIAEVPAVEVITTVAIHLMSAAAVKCGLGADDADTDLDEARKLITALAGLVVTSAPDLGTFHAAPLRDGLRSLQMAFREASPYPDAPGFGPGEKLTGPVA